MRRYPWRASSRATGAWSPSGTVCSTTTRSQPLVVAVSQLGGVGVQRDPHPQRGLGGPGLGAQRLLEGAGGGERIGGLGEDGEEAVALAAALDEHPRCCAMTAAASASWRATAAPIVSGCCSQSRVLLSISVKRNVTVPVGSKVVSMGSPSRPRPS
jgi:hypothetical protein